MSNNTIKSDLGVLTNGTNAISTISKGAEVSGGYSKDTYGSTSRCPSKEPTTIDIYLSTCKELFQKVTEEMGAINKVGEAFDHMDNVMKNTATTINMQIKSIALSGIEAKTFESKDEILKKVDTVDEKIDALAKEKGITFGTNNDGLEDIPTGSDGYYDSGSSSNDESDDDIEEVTNIEETPVETPISNAAPQAVVNNDNKEAKVANLKAEPSKNNNDKETLEFVENENPFDDINIVNNIDIPEPDMLVKDVIEPEKKASPYGAASIVAGIGLATGAAAYGTNKYINDKKEKDDDEYDYDKDEDYEEGSDAK